MSLPHNFEDSMRKHDSAIYSWLDALRVDYNGINGEDRRDFPILRVFAAPHRAFAQAYDLLVKMGWAAGGSDDVARVTSEADWATLPLPFCTIDRDYPMFAGDLAASALTYEKTIRDPQTGDWIVLPYPLHAYTMYRLTFWCLKRYTEAFILEWLYTRFGSRGAGNREVFLPVHHEWPFGDQLHALRWVGTGDQSELEGESPRYLRTSATLLFRTWFMRGNLPEARREPPVHAIQRQAHEEANLLPTAAWWGSGNLWTVRDPSDPATLAVWPRWGSATVASDGSRGLSVGLTGGVDRIYVVEPGSIAYPDGYQILGLAGTVVSDGPATLAVEELYGDPTPWVLPQMPVVYPPPAAPPVQSAFSPIYLAPELSGELRIGRRVWQMDVSSASGTFHEFVVAAGSRFMYLVEGGPADVTLGRIDVRQIADADRVLPTAVDDAGTEWVHRWEGLTPSPRLIVVLFTSPALPGEQLTFQDDGTSPTFTRIRTIPNAHTRGLVALLQPKTTSLGVRVPKTVGVAGVHVRPFDGPFLGGTLPT